jgi:signal peptidase I
MFSELITDLLKDGFKVSFTAPGHSMFPTIIANETVLVEPIEPSAVSKGDIVLYRSNGNLIAHRVMGIITDAKGFEYSNLLNAFKPAQASHACQDSAKKSSRSSVLSPHHFIILRGDACFDFDKPVASDRVMGKVVFIQRNGRSINPYSRKHKLTCRVRIWASRLERLLS